MHTTSALAAKAIKGDLKRAFPNIKFSVRSENYSMGDNVNISYTDGPKSADVDELVAKYRDGDFDGMIDLYEYRPNPNNLPRAKYIFVNRSISAPIKTAMKNIIARKFGITNPDDDRAWFATFNSWADQVIYGKLEKLDLTGVRL